MQNNKPKLKDPAHPLKARLRQLGIAQRIAAFNVNVGFQQFTKYLNGSCQMPARVEQSLNKLLQEVE
jgi:hypothetical protein